MVDIRERVLPEMRKVLSMERSARHTLTRHHNNDSHDSRENHHDNCSSSSGSDDVNSSSNCNNNHDNNSCDGTLDGYNKDGHNNVGDERDDAMMVEDYYDDYGREDDEEDENYDDSYVDINDTMLLE